LVPNTSTSLQAKLATEAHLAEGQFLPDEQTLNIERKFDIKSRNSKTNSFQKRGAEFRTKINLNKEHE
jgi:hypothetical protein